VEAFVEFDTHEDERDLDPFGVPAIAIRRSGCVWIVDELFAKALTLSCDRTFRPHTARGHPNPHKSHENTRESG
jgi:hypothetical protein